MSDQTSPETDEMRHRAHEKASPAPDADRAAEANQPCVDCERKDREFDTCERLLREAYEENAKLRRTAPVAGEVQVTALLTSLAERWEEMADQSDEAIGHFEGPTATILNAEVAERGRTYRHAASDVREVLRTGRIPEGLLAGSGQAAEAQPATTGTCGRALATGQPCPDHPATDQAATQTVTDVVAAIVTALQERAGELSELAEEQMRPSLEERAQEWLEAAEIAQKAVKAQPATTAAPAAQS